MGEFCNGLGAKSSDPAQLEASWLTVLRRLDGGHKGRLAWCATSAFATSALAADIGVVDLHPTGQLFGCIALHHDLRQFVLDLPGCGLGHAKTPAEFDTGNALLGLGQMVHGAKPNLQRQFSGREDCPRDRRSLPAALAALK